MAADASHDPGLAPPAQLGALPAPRPAVPEALTGAAVAVDVAVALGLTLRSLGWPLVHDAPLMHYIAARILDGAVPYRDIFDINFPGVYLAHVLALLVFGPGDLGFRLFDLALLGAVMAGLFVALRPYGTWAGTAAAALFWLYHLAGGEWRAGQRDLILCLPLAWMLAAGLRYVSSGRLWTLGTAGLLLGAAMWIKPDAALLLPALAAVALVRSVGTRGRALLILAAGFMAPSLAFVSWLTWVGGLAPLLDIVGGYLVPLYSRLGRVPLWTAIEAQHRGAQTLLGLAAWGGGGLLVLSRPRGSAGSADSADSDGRTTLLAAGLLYGALHFALQGKGWEYHLYPLALFTCALGGAGLATALASGSRLATGVLATVLLFLTLTLGVKGEESLGWTGMREKVEHAHALARLLAPYAARGGTIQVLDTTDGGIHALYLLGARQPTRFLYDFHFYHDPDHPYVRRLRAELIDGLSAHPPAVVVLFRHGWPSGDYDRLNAFPALRAWLETGYLLSGQTEDYRIYAARRGR